MSRMAALLALAASSLIALSSCSGGQPASGTSTVTATGARIATSPASATAGPVGTTGDLVRVGPLTLDFATTLPTDQAKAKVIEGWRQSQVIWDQSIQAWRVLATASAYVKGKAFTGLRAAVATDVGYHVILTGTNRFYDTNVTSLTADGATVTSCDDSANAIDENPSTGQKFPHNASDILVFFVIWQLAPVTGHWAISSYSLVAAPDPRERVCGAS
jgi:hypothetical protein